MSAVEPPRMAQTVYLKDYRPPEFRIETAELYFDLREAGTIVRSRLFIERDARTPPSHPLVLSGEGMELVSVALDGRTLTPGEYRVDEEGLTVPGVPARFALETENRIHPADNTALEGLYVSGGNFCTQCEAEGFRRITYFLDRPDVMARYTTTLVADRARCPVLLSNGNPVAHGELADGRHWVRWEDPFPKPSYLFALVGGDLAWIEDEFTTRSGRKVRLRLYVQRHNLDKCAHAMECLKRAMRWDEEAYGREYDLDLFMIVAVDDFNMGAMENKGLNIFNSACVLASPGTATDDDFQAILGVVGHEYFHNWSGNRVTCRDWFQLSLKEGFTVFRDQEFSAETASRGVERIRDVNVLRNAQFREDAGPMAHPVRPESYQEIGNFYTATVYLKGAEVVRMLRNLLGAEGFRRGADLYFERHDGRAVTTDDFVCAMEDAAGADLAQFRLWYSQAGSPELHVERRYDPGAGTCTLTVRQDCPPTPGQPEKAPFHIPLAVGLLTRDGRELPLCLAGEAHPVAGTRVLELRREVETFVFTGIPEEPVVSLLRGFSAPVKVHMDRDDEELAFLMARDTDSFSRWDAGQELAVKVLLRLVEAQRNGADLAADPVLVEAFRRSLLGAEADRAFLARLLTLPSEDYVAESLDRIDPVAVHEAHRFLRRALAKALHEPLLETYRSLGESGPYRIDPDSVGRRSLRNLCLGYLMQGDDPRTVQLCLDQFHSGTNMTDVLAALSALARSERPEREPALEEFYERWKDDPLVVDKWFAIQASAPLPDALERVRALTRHPAFNPRNPNKIRALVGAFCRGNPARFHARDGAGYAFLGDWILELDPINPQIAARLVGVLSRWRRYEPRLGELMRAQLERVLAAPNLSRDTYEIASKSLA
ncbi:aminopeptidase N [bacterium BMS3Bbin12]|nr:aminopeptidase N [bacterium BMS3Abin12]GBE47004.1 aminopeptidase N [bacterium BMS3Bbin12]GBE49509.1 aminopeptidase N [bacterium BMS3Bbin13]HDK03681.1 aminopeptidase N [Gammaproteobacteria bacterium]